MLSVVTTLALGYNMQLARMPAARTAVRRMAGTARMALELEESGEFGTTDYSMTFKQDGKVVSPWHDMPLELEGGLYNMLTEIPKMTFKKMEVDTKAPGNPIKQDEKKGKARLYHGPIFWNYGCLPQTWEDPNVKGDADVGGAFGDDDPVDVVEIGASSLEMGSFTPVKVLGCLSMIDDGELDWKVCSVLMCPPRGAAPPLSAPQLLSATLPGLAAPARRRRAHAWPPCQQVIALNAADEHADAINDVGDIEKFYPGTVSGIREWFRWYKTPDDKPVNGFGHGERALSAAETKEVIKETNGFYKKLISGETDAGKLWVPAPAAAA